MSLNSILSHIQKELKAPKNQYNSFAKFYYRNTEDILEGLKKVLPDNVFVTLEDSIELVGDRIYVKATASLKSENACISASAFAREPLLKKGCDESQLTGLASSYARKYALSGLFLIDDSKDSDSKDNKKEDTERDDLLDVFRFYVKDLDIGLQTLKIWAENADVENIENASNEHLQRLIGAMKQRKGESNV